MLTHEVTTGPLGYHVLIWKIQPVSTYFRYTYDLWSTINVLFIFEFRRKIAYTKTQQGTDKLSEHNERKVFSRVSTGGVNFFLYLLSYIYYTSYLFAATYLLASRYPPTADYALTATKPLL